MPRKMKKYIRPEKHKGVRSIPLRNPRKVDGMLMPPSPTSGPTEECFDARRQVVCDQRRQVHSYYRRACC